MRKLFSLSFLVSLLAVLILSSCDGESKNNTNGEEDLTEEQIQMKKEQEARDKVLDSLNNKDRTAVKSDRAGINEVIIHISGDIDKLNPLISTSADASYVQGKLFSQLLDVDPDSFTLFPVIALHRPTISMVTEGEYKDGLKMEWELRPEAVWDNGSPITGYDVAFTLKAVKNPQVDAEQQRPWLEFIDDVIVDEANPKKFTYMCKGHYFLSEYSAGLQPIMPEYFYDAQKTMRKFSMKDLNNPETAAKLKSNADIIAFAKKFNSEKFSREKSGINGSGPYTLDNWVTGQRVVVKRKANWWGDKLKGTNRDFTVNPSKITYEVIVDVNAATSALKGEKIDVLDGMKAKDWIELSADGGMTDKYRFYKPDQLAFSYIGLNMRNPKLADFKVRRALAHCIDVDKIIAKISYGLAKRVVGPISPRKAYYNADLKPIKFDIAAANKLLDEAGWNERDENGVRVKTIDGVKTKLALDIKYPSGSDVVEKIMTLFQENCKKAGIEISQSQREWTVFLQENKAHNFEMFYGSWISAPIPDDEKQIWHTSSYDGGSNYVGFGDQKSDEIIEKIRYEMDDAKRAELYKEFQKIVYETQPYIFMSTPFNRMAVHARYLPASAGPKVARPGYAETEFELDRTFGSKTTDAKPQ